MPQFLRYSDKPEPKSALLRKPILVKMDPRLVSVSGRDTLTPEYRAFISAQLFFPDADYLFVSRPLMEGGIASGVYYYSVAAFVKDESGKKSGRMKGLLPKPPFVETGETIYLASDEGKSLYSKGRDPDNLLRLDAWNKVRNQGRVVVMGDGGEMRYNLDESLYRESGARSFRATRLYPVIAFYDPNPEIKRVVTSPGIKGPPTGKAIRPAGKPNPIDELLDREVEEILKKARAGKRKEGK